MKEIFFLTKHEYLHWIRMLSNAWELERPNQLKWIVQELHNRHSLTGVTRIIA